MNLSVIGETSLHHNSTSGQLEPTHSFEEPHYEKLGQDIPILVLYTFTTIIGVFGNSIVVYVVFTRKITTTTYILIGNLAISDILGSLSIPRKFHYNQCMH